ncbi:class I SAM-dependent methyltransferase [Gramella jeungdoensis]|uniref:Class I SAM-dependent methyltransferase n=1 Tax=Gramella jeungdoensis TaxID=708091 RepID=A0ABT0YX68_9FLAO|nr:class I SAM-dependent methyltransferase [Gramella jeungdoensis]MCM8568057.1 class I SAM-dependent methyltransferase [Gramella jeungdoensis]
MDKNKDIFGKAIKAFFEENDETNIIVHSPDFEDDTIPVKYLFRDFDEMPPLEQKALELCRGKVLDVGCGAGSHSLYLQNLKDLKCTGIDTSTGAIEIAKKRGLKNAECKDFFELKNEKFDTILMLMNGSGIIGKLKNLKKFFEHSRSILQENGQILLDSSDLIYLFDEELPEQEEYYGELKFQLSYKDSRSDFFDWLYLDPVLLEKEALKNKFSCKIIQKGRHFDYLAILKPL